MLPLSLAAALSLGAEPNAWSFDFAPQPTDRPFTVSVAVPEGNYLVTVTLGEPAGASATTVKAELRRLMLENVVTANGETVTRTFAVNVRAPAFPGGEVRLKDRERKEEWRAWDEKLTLEFSGPRPRVRLVEVRRAELPTVYLMGDSTVCDQPGAEYASWGQMLTRFFKPTVAVANHAESGESLRSSAGARRLDKVLSGMKPGDFLLIQFGHNDMKAYDEASYAVELKKYVAAAKAKGGAVVLVTPMHRRTFAGSTITNSHRGFPDAVRAVAAEEKLPLIDLHAASKTLYEALGPDGSGALFKRGDGTHHNPYGAYQLARCVVEGVRANVPELAKHLADDAAPFDPAKPDPVDRFKVSDGIAPSLPPPDGK